MELRSLKPLEGMPAGRLRSPTQTSTSINTLSQGKGWKCLNRTRKGDIAVAKKRPWIFKVDVEYLRILQLGTNIQTIPDMSSLMSLILVLWTGSHLPLLLAFLSALSFRFLAFRFASMNQHVKFGRRRSEEAQREHKHRAAGYEQGSRSQRRSASLAQRVGKVVREADR